VTLTLDPVRLPPPEKAITPTATRGLGTQEVLAITVGALGLASAAVGTVSGLTAASKKSDAEKACPDLCSTAGGVSEWSDAKTAGNVSTVAFLAAGVGLTVAAVLWFSATREPSRPAPMAEIDLGPSSVQVRGTW
jgi:hypothetical protein